MIEISHEEAYRKACQIIGEITMQHRFVSEQLQKVTAEWDELKRKMEREE